MRNERTGITKIVIGEFMWEKEDDKKRWFDWKYGKLPSERAVKEIFEIIDNRKKKIFKNT
ncbi:MAG: hypothetical protein AB1765_12885 [Candidatus Hydrogenedentota bacterium]